MKKFLLKVSVFAVYVILMHTVFPVWVDPFNVFHTDNIRANGVMPNKNYIKMNYVLKNPGKFDSFLFGSSRVGAIHTDRITGEKCYNMVYSSGLPLWHLWNIKTMLANNIHPQKIYIGLDHYSINEETEYQVQINTHSTCPYEYIQENRIHFYGLYLNPAMIAQSFEAMINARLGRSEIIDTEAFYKWGWDIPYNRPVRIDWDNKRHVKPAIKPHRPGSVGYALGIIMEISQLCRDNNIELVIFTNPLHHVTYLPAIKDSDYEEFLEGLAEISDFWNFSSLNDITLSNDCYRETSHYKAKIGDLIIDIMCNGKTYPELQAQGFGVKVRRENVKDFLGMLKAQLTPEE